DAVPALGYVARREPCRPVRLAALKALQELGAGGADELVSSLTPEDAADLGRLASPKPPLGRALSIDTPGDGMTAGFFEGGGDDLRLCSSAEHFEAMKPHLCGGPSTIEPAKAADAAARREPAQRPPANLEPAAARNDVSPAPPAN